MLDYYDQREFQVGEPTNTSVLIHLVEESFGIDPHRDSLQYGDHGLAIYPSSAFCLDLPANYATHHFEGSWLTRLSGRETHGDRVNATFHLERLLYHCRDVKDEVLLRRLFAEIGTKRAIKALAGLITQLPRRFWRERARSQ